MDIKDLQRIVINALEDVKGRDIRLFDTTAQTSMFDRILVASGTSNRQTRALAMSVRDKVKEAGGTVVSMEGEKVGEWVLVDLGDMVVHVMQPAIRDYYRLEEIWGEREVNITTAKRKPRKAASEKSEVVPKKPATRKAPAKKDVKSVTTKTPAKSAASKPKAEPVKRTRAKRQAAE